MFIQASEDLSKGSFKNLSNINDNKLSKNSLEFKYSSNLSGFSTQLSMIEFIKDLEDRKKVIKYMSQQVSKSESEINELKKQLNEKSIASQKIFTDNQVIRD